MKKISVIGHFALGLDILSGQTIKTKIVTEELQNQFGENQILRIDTHGGWKTLLKAPFQAYQALKNSSNVLIFPAHNGLRIYAPLLSFLKIFFKNRKLHYMVIGGWMPHFVKRRPALKKTLKKFDNIFVETTTMKKALDAQGFKNVSIVPNFKKLTVLSKNELVYTENPPYKLCTFSRIMKEKGIETAAKAVLSANKTLGYEAFNLDIFGQVDAAQEEWFETLKKTFPGAVRYGGLIPFEQSVEVLKEYFALLFPTHFYTEGIPGTIIDAYAAGIPVISAKWESFADIIDDGVTGIGYEFDDPADLEQKLIFAANSPEKLNALKENCLLKAKEYAPDSIIQNMAKEFREV